MANSIAPQTGQQGQLNDAVNLARAALVSCTSKLFGAGTDPVGLLDKLVAGNAGVGSLRLGDLGAGSTNATTTGITGSRTVTRADGTTFRQSIFTGANIVINSNAAAAFQSGYGGRFGASDAVNRAVTIIHELGHAVNVIYGRGSAGIFNDVTTPPSRLAATASALNSERVYRECFETSILGATR